MFTVRSPCAITRLRRDPHVKRHVCLRRDPRMRWHTFTERLSCKLSHALRDPYVPSRMFTEKPRFGMSHMFLWRDPLRETSRVFVDPHVGCHACLWRNSHVRGHACSQRWPCGTLHMFMERPPSETLCMFTERPSCVYKETPIGMSRMFTETPPSKLYTLQPPIAWQMDRVPVSLDKLVRSFSFAIGSMVC